jgi:hypothetical protein
MKSILVFCFLLTIGAGYHQGQQPGKEKAVDIKPESTLKETTDWLKEKTIRTTDTRVIRVRFRRSTFRTAP